MKISHCVVLTPQLLPDTLTIKEWPPPLITTNQRRCYSSPPDASSTPDSPTRKPTRCCTALERPTCGSVDRPPPPSSDTRRPRNLNPPDPRPALLLSLNPLLRASSRRYRFRKTLHPDLQSLPLNPITPPEKNRMEMLRSKSPRSIGSSSTIPSSSMN